MISATNPYPKDATHSERLSSAWYIEYRGLFGIMVFSLAIKVALAVSGEVINPDGVLYIAAAQQYAAANFSEGLRLYAMPAYPLLIAGIHLVIPDWVTAARTITIGSMVLASIPLYKTTALLFDRRAAFWAALFLAITPEANENALRVIRDPIFLFFTLTTIYFVVKGLELKSVRWIVVGLFFAGATLLFRVEGVVIFTIPPIFLWMLAWTSRDKGLRAVACRSAALWMGIPLLVGIVLAAALGPQFLTQNRVDELTGEVRALTRLDAFQKYRQIYAFFKTIQNEPPFSGFSHSLPATVRHWMPLVYLIGLLESLIKQLYPLFLLPLFANLFEGWRKGAKFTPQKAFILVLFISYLLMLYYFLVTRDRMVGRLLFTPAVLLYPWIGAGFGLLIDMSPKEGRLARFASVVLMLLLLVLPGFKTAKEALISDRSALTVGRAIVRDPVLGHASILFSDTRHAFYANRLDNFFEVRNIASQIDYYVAKGDHASIEKMAMDHGADALVIFVNSHKERAEPAFNKYAQYKRVPGKRGITIIYRQL